MRFILVLTSLLAVPIAPAFGQIPLQPGDRVRITAPADGLRRHVGVLGALDSATITVDSLRIARNGVTQLDVYRGRRGHAGTGAIAGGLTTGLLLGVGSAAFCSDPYWGCDPGPAFAAGFLAGGVTGTLIGAAVGALIRSDAWEEHTGVAAHPVVTIAPEHGLALGWSLRF